MHSASDTDPTTPNMAPTKRELGLWDVIRVFAGLAAGGVFIYGTIRLIVLGVNGHAIVLTRADVADLATAVAMTICGLFVCWCSFGAQRTAERRAEQHNELAALFLQQKAINDDLNLIVTRIDGLTIEVHNLLAAEKGQQVHSVKARSDVAQIQADVADLRLGLAEMSLKVPSEASLLATLKAYIDAIFAQFGEHVDKVAKEAAVGRYVDDVRTRINGSRPHLHAVETE